jgi:hypothetical protein
MTTNQQTKTHEAINHLFASVNELAIKTGHYVQPKRISVHFQTKNGQVTDAMARATVSITMVGFSTKEPTQPE